MPDKPFPEPPEPTPHTTRVGKPIVPGFITNSWHCSCGTEGGCYSPAQARAAAREHKRQSRPGVCCVLLENTTCREAAAWRVLEHREGKAAHRPDRTYDVCDTHKRMFDAQSDYTQRADITQTWHRLAQEAEVDA